MKKRIKLLFLKGIFQFVSFITNLTKGANLFVNWKTALGVLIIGMTVSSCKHKPASEVTTTCYDTSGVDTTVVIQDTKVVK